MKLLVYGAGVTGRMFAVRMHEAGHDVSLVARGEHLTALREHGVRFAENESSEISHVRVPMVEQPVGRYDLIAVFVRTHQVDAVLESIAQLEGDVLFLLNWAAGPEPLGDAIGHERVLLGFPPADTGGTMDGEVVRYRRSSPLTRLVSMPIGEPDGSITPRVQNLVQTFRSVGFKAKAERHMDAWLKTHAAFEAPLGKAVHDAGGPDALAADPDAIRDMIRAIRRNLAAMPERPVPRAFNALRIVPEGVLVPVFRRFLHSSAAGPLNTDSQAVAAELDRLIEQLHALSRE